ncbi:MAG: tetratricopeptide repeat protein [Gemmatimonadota bacterium]
MSIEALKEQARGHEQEEEWEKALSLYVQAIQRHGSEDQPDLGLYNRAGDLSTRLGNLEGALEYYEQAVKLYLESELPNNAIAILKKILRNLPYRTDVFLQMGKIRASQGFLVDARENFLRYAEVMQQEGNLPAALQALTEFAELAPSDLDIQFMVVSQLQANEQGDQAVEHLTRTWVTLSRSGQDEAAAAIEERLREIAPDAELPDATDDYDAFETTSLTDSLDSGATDADAGSAERLVDEAVAETLGVDEDAPYGSLDIEHTHLGSSDDAASSPFADGGLDLETSSGFEQSIWEEDEGSVDPLPSLDLAVEEEPASESDAWDVAESTLIVEDALEAGEEADSLEAEGEEDSLEAEGEEDALVAEGEEDALEAGKALEAVAEDSFSVPVTTAWEEPAVEDSLPVEAWDASGDASATDEAWGLSEAGSEESTLSGSEDDWPAGSLTWGSEDGEGEEGDPLPTLELDSEGAWESGESWNGDAPAFEDDEEVVAAAGLEDAWISVDEDDADTEPAAPSVEDAVAVETAWGSEVDDDEGPIEDGETWLGMAARLRDEGDTEEAKTALEEAYLSFAEAMRFDRASAAVATLIEMEPDALSHHQRRVEYANRSGDQPMRVAAYLGLAECLERSGSESEARAVYEKLLEVDPSNERASIYLASVEQPVIESAYVDLGSMVIDRVEKTTRWTVEAEEPATEEDFDFREMLSQFKAKVAEHVDVGDVRAHYDLGTAYREMGLMDEAISEFQLALRADGKNLATYEMLGQCFMEKGQPEFAVRSLGRATQLPHDVEDELLGIYYYLGRAHEELGQRDEAVEFYEKVFSLDINFQDVTERLRSLR